MEIYSQKAENIIQAYFSDHGWTTYDRKPNGAFNLKTYELRCLVDDILYYTKQKNIVNTVRTRAQDERELRLWGVTAPAKTFSLLVALLNNMYTPEAIRRHWGDEAVDEMVGKPLNVMETQRRAVIMGEIQRLHTECEDERRELYHKHVADVNAATSDLSSAIKELQEKIDSLLAEKMKLNDKKSAITKELYSKYSEADREISEKYGSKIDEHKKALGQIGTTAQTQKPESANSPFV